MRSPRTLVRILVIVAVADFIVTGLLAHAGIRAGIGAAALDAVLLSALVVPFLQRWVLPPMVRRRIHLLETVESGKQETLTAAVEQTEDVVVITDANGVIQYVNPAFERVSGYTKAEAIGKKPSLLKSGHHPKAFYKTLWDTILSGQVFHGVLLNRNKQGELYYEELSIFPLKDSQGRISRFVATGRDISMRRRTETALKESEQRYADLIENAPDPILTLDRLGFLQSMNPAAEQLSGYPRQELIGRHFAKMGLLTAASLPRVLGEFSAVIAGVTRPPFEFEIARKDGARRTFEANPRAILQADKVVGVQAICRDVTERKQAEGSLRDSQRQLQETLAQLKDAQQQLIQQERLGAIGQMASGIAHDFNNALAAILGFTEILLMNPSLFDDRERVTRHLRMIHDAAEDAAEVVRRLREFYRKRDDVEATQAVNLVPLARQVIALTQPKWRDQVLASGRTITIETDLQPVPAVLGNEVEVREILTNLLFNAVDAMPNGGTITLRTRREEQWVVLEVSDTGVGMSEEVRQRCLEPFFTTKGSKGSGLGLSMVYGIIKRHEGILKIDTHPGKGTTFSIRLLAHAPFPEAATHETAGVWVRPLHVLLVEDDPLVREALGAYLTNDGHTVETAVNGREGLTKFRAGRFDLIVTDRVMPEMSGDQLAVAIKQVAPRKPIIMVTGFGEMITATGDRPRGIDLILSKPVSVTAFKGALARASRMIDNPSTPPDPGV